MGVASAGLQAAVLGAVAAYLTYAFTGPLALHWELKDYGFVTAVTLAVFYNRLKTQKYEGLMQAEQTKQMSQAPELRRIELVHGQPVQLELNKITCLLFFGSWCKDSRAALQQFQRLRRSITHGAVQFLALTQESREELRMYEVKGRTASDFQELQDFPFSIAIEDGHMAKEYLVRYDVCKIPTLFIITKSQSVLWYGNPQDKAVEKLIRHALGEDNVPTPQYAKLLD